MIPTPPLQPQGASVQPAPEPRDYISYSLNRLLRQLDYLDDLTLDLEALSFKEARRLNQLLPSAAPVISTRRFTLLCDPSYENIGNCVICTEDLRLPCTYGPLYETAAQLNGKVGRLTLLRRKWEEAMWAPHGVSLYFKTVRHLTLLNIVIPISCYIPENAKPMSGQPWRRGSIPEKDAWPWVSSQQSAINSVSRCPTNSLYS